MRKKLIAEEMYQKSKSAWNQQSVSYFIKTYNRNDEI